MTMMMMMTPLPNNLYPTTCTLDMPHMEMG